MELGSYTERQRQRDPLNTEHSQSAFPASFTHQPAPLSTDLQFANRGNDLRSAFGWPGEHTGLRDTPLENRDVLGSSYSPYDVAYRGQVFADSAFERERQPPTESKFSRIRVIVVIVLLSLLGAALYLRRRYSFKSILKANLDDPCTIDKSQICAAYSFPDGFDEKKVLLVDASPNTNNFLFRSSLPLEKGTGNFVYDQLRAAMEIEAAEKVLSLPSDFRPILVTLEWNETNGLVQEQCEVAREACQSQSYPGTMTIHWPLYGQATNPFSFPLEKRTTLARTFNLWDYDSLDQKVRVLYEVTHNFMAQEQQPETVAADRNNGSGSSNREQLQQKSAKALSSPGPASLPGIGKREEAAHLRAYDTDKAHPSPVENSTEVQQHEPQKLQQLPLVTVVHCHHGKDRTGLLVASYKMRFMQYSLQDVFRENYELGQDLLETVRAMMWYCLYLETSLNSSTAQCFDIEAANPQILFTQNGKAPQTPPGILPTADTRGVGADAASQTQNVENYTKSSASATNGGPNASPPLAADNRQSSSRSTDAASLNRRAAPALSNRSNDAGALASPSVPQPQPLLLPPSQQQTGGLGADSKQQQLQQQQLVESTPLQQRSNNTSLNWSASVSQQQPAAVVAAAQSLPDNSMSQRLPAITTVSSGSTPEKSILAATPTGTMQPSVVSDSMKPASIDSMASNSSNGNQFESVLEPNTSPIRPATPILSSVAGANYKNAAP